MQVNRLAEPSALEVGKGSVLVIVYICSLPGLVMNFLPLLVSAMTTSIGLSEQQSGFIASADMAGYTVGTVTAFLLIKKVNWRNLARHSLLLMLLANLICSQTGGFLALLTLRFLSGVGGGMVAAVLLSVIAQLRNPEAIYGLWFAVMSLITIVGMTLFPRLLEHVGLGPAYLALATMVVVCLPFLYALPHGAINTRPESIATAKQTTAVLSIVTSILVLTTGIGSAWAFLGQIGSAAGFSIEQVSYAIAVSAAGGVVGGLGASWLDLRRGRALPVSISCSGLVVTMLLLMTNSPSYSLYAICCLAVYGLWSFVLPFLLGALAELERSGRGLSLGCTAQGAGFMVGPFLASMLLYVGGYDTVLTFAASSIVFCFGLFLLGQRKPRFSSMPKTNRSVSWEIE